VGLPKTGCLGGLGGSTGNWGGGVRGKERKPATKKPVVISVRGEKKKKGKHGKGG